MKKKRKTLNSRRTKFRKQIKVNQKREHLHTQTRKNGNKTKWKTKHNTL